MMCYTKQNKKKDNHNFRMGHFIKVKGSKCDILVSVISMDDFFERDLKGVDKIVRVSQYF